MTARSYHMALDVRGFLMRAKRREYKNMLKHESGRPMTEDEAKMALLDELAKGHEFIPYGKCDNFDFKSGCLGHDVPEKTTGEPA